MGKKPSGGDFDSNLNLSSEDIEITSYSHFIPSMWEKYKQVFENFMWIIGVTGAIGAGKSTLSQYFRLLGVPVHCADQEVHHLLESNSDIQKKIKKRWPEVFVAGKIDRRLLGDQVIKSQDELKTLEEILYPLLTQSQKRFLKKHQTLKTPFVVIGAPLLFEVGLAPYCHCVILADAPLFLRKKRVLQRKNATKEKFKTFEAHQLNNNIRKRMADVIIPTGRDKGHSLRRIKEILSDISHKEPLFSWQGKWPYILKREIHDKRNCFRHRNNRI